MDDYEAEIRQLQRQPHEGSLGVSGRAVREVLLKYRAAPVAIVDVLAGIAAAAYLPDQDAAMGERIAVGMLALVLVPLFLWGLVSLIHAPLVLRQQRDYARMERDWYKLRVKGAVLDYHDIKSLTRYWIAEGSKLYRRTFYTRRLMELHDSAYAWQRDLARNMEPLDKWQQDWGNPPEPPVGRRQLREWLRDRVGVLKGMV
jgi:hypothetical protein